MLKKYTNSHFFFNNVVKISLWNLQVDSGINLEFKQTNNENSDFIEMAFNSINEDFQGLSMNRNILKDIMKFIWGPFNYEITEKRNLVGYLTYEKINSLISVKVILKSECWKWLHQIIICFCDENLIKGKEVLVQYPNSVKFSFGNNLVKTKPILLFNTFQTIGG